MYTRGMKYRPKWIKIGYKESKEASLLIKDYLFLFLALVYKIL